MIDLFAGTGGFHLGFTDPNVKVVFANDFTDISKVIYEHNFDTELNTTDLNDLQACSIPAHDLLTGGFPCQPFSIAGKREGFNDPRSNVFWKMIEILQYHKPRCIVLENVKNLLTDDNGQTFEVIKTNLERVGYYLKFSVLNTAHITGIPQHRERLYIVGFRDHKLCEQMNFDFPKIQKQPIQNFLCSQPVEDKYYYLRNGTIPDRGATKSIEIANTLATSVVNPDTVYQYRRVYVRENKNNECPTLTNNMGGGGHNVPIILDAYGIRKLTPRECFNFQGFPEDYHLPDNLSNSSLYKLAGNAISVPVVKLISKKIIDILKENSY
jgi:DNA (cytosine-5)-methyltransferase 1